MKKKALAVAVCLFTAIVAAHSYRTFDPYITICRWPHGKKIAFTITCDDISSGYPLEYLEEILSVFEKYRMKATFFVIPYHGEWDLLTDSPAFVEALHEAERKGHEIGLHGYAHYEDEFVCSPEEQTQLLEKALSIMEEARFTVKGFRAPCLRATPETQKILKEHNFVYDSSIFGESGEILWEGDLPQILSGHEYTWYIREEDLPESLALAKQEFSAQYEKGTIFSVVTHMKAVNEGEGMAFLESFLSCVEEDVWNCTLLELVEWEKTLQDITWKSRKTFTGGEITFQNIPHGLVIEIGLPPHYYLKDLPSGITATTETHGETCITEVTFDQHFKEITLSFALKYPSSNSKMKNELLIFHNPNSHDLSGNPDSDSLTSLTAFLAAWEIPYRVVEVNSEISFDLLKNSSLILIDSTFLKRSLTEEEEKLLRSLKDRVIILSGVDLPFFFERLMRTRKNKDYIGVPLDTGLQYDGWLDLGYYRIKILEGKSVYIMFEKLTQKNSYRLYCNSLIRTLFVFSHTPTRQPFFSLEIDDCAMYETLDNQGDTLVVDLQTYKNSFDLAHSYGLTPIYGFTTSFFSYTPELETIFAFLNEKNCLVANHGYHHCLNFADPHVLASEIGKANTDIETMWGNPPVVILVPCHEMHQESMVEALAGTPIQFVGALNLGYTFGVFNEILFYERTSLQLSSVAVNDAPPFRGLFLYYNSVPPSVYAVTHIFNYCKKGSAYQYIADACEYLICIGYTPSDTETMAEEDFFWNFVDLKSYTEDGLVVELSGLNRLPEREKEYIIHFMVYSTPSLSIVGSDGYCIESTIVHKNNLTYVTLTVQPETHLHKLKPLPKTHTRTQKKKLLSSLKYFQ